MLIFFPLLHLQLPTKVQQQINPHLRRGEGGGGAAEVVQSSSMSPFWQLLIHLDTVVPQRVSCPLTFDPCTSLPWDKHVGSLFCHASLMQSNGSPSGLGWCRLSPKKKKAFKAGGMGKKNVKGVKKDKNRWAHPWSGSLCQLRWCFFRLAMGHHRLCCTCTCSRVRWEWPGGGRERQPAGEGQSQQRFPRPAGTQQRDIK